MKRALTALILALCFAFPASAQKATNKAQEKRDKAQQTADAEDAKTTDLLQKAAQSPEAKRLLVNVRDHVDASAVLIPAHDASRIFGPEIGRHYAVVEVNVGNKSPDAALVIHSIFIDYTRWGLSGVAPGDGDSQDDDSGKDWRTQYQSQTRSTQVASEEYRLVRGQFLNAQTWRTRSWVMRLLTLAGNVAGAYTFSLNEQGIIKGIAAFNGVVVPGINTAWPDTGQDQMNRINDLGFKAEKFVAKGGSEVVVCFFPIDRFLTPGFRKLFLKAPSLSFAPDLLLLDKSIQKDVVNVLGEDLGVTPAALDLNSTQQVLPKLHEYMPCYVNILNDAKMDRHADVTLYAKMKRTALEGCLHKFGLMREVKDGRETGALTLDPTNPKAQYDFATFVALDHISQISLNKVSVTIDGVMTVDTSGIAPKVDSVSFDDVAGCAGPNAPCFWSPVVAGGARTGTISGSYLTDGKVSITGSGEAKVSGVTTVSEGSSDQQLRFSFKLEQGVTNGDLAFKVSKQQRGSDKPLESDPFVVHIGGGGAGSLGGGLPQPSVTEVKVKDDTTLSVEGSDFFDTPTYRLGITLIAPDDKKEVEVEQSALTIKDDKHLEVKIPDEADTPGCWRVTATINSTAAGPPPKNNTFSVQPKVTSVTRDGDKIIVAGEGLDALTCGNKPVAVTLINGDVKVKVGGKPTLTSTSATFALPADAKKADNTWTAQVQFGSKDVADKPFKLEIKQ